MGVEFAFTAIKTLYDIIEKTYTHYKVSHKEQWDKSRNIKIESQEILKEVSSLIDKFAETCDLIVQTLTEFYDSKKYDFVRISQANRHLFELSSDMRVLVNSLSGRLDQIDTHKVKRLADSCYQIILVENYIGAELVKHDNFNLLPIDVSPREMRAYQRLFPRAYSDQFPHDTEPNGKVVIRNMNKALLDLRRCKENLAKILNEIEQVD